MSIIEFISSNEIELRNLGSKAALIGINIIFQVDRIMISKSHLILNE